MHSIYDKQLMLLLLIMTTVYHCWSFSIYYDDSQ